MDGVAAEERGRSAAGGMGWLDIGNGVGKMASAGGVGAAASCAASASKAWVVAWLAASSLSSPVAAFVDNVGGTVYAIPNTLRLPRRVHDARGDYVSAPRRLQKTR